MTLEDWANLGQLVAAVAVVVSLVYLAIQVRCANAIARTNAYRDFNQDWGAVLREVAADRDLHHIWRRGLHTDEELSVEEQERLGMLLIQIFGVLNTGYQSSWVDRSIRDYVQSILDFHLDLPYVRAWWSRQAARHPEPFRSYVESRIAALAARTGGP